MAYGKAPEHRLVLRPKRTHCIYCRRNENWEPKQQGQARIFGGDITNIRDDITNIRDSSGGQLRGSKTLWGCAKCNVALCKIGDYWRLWHKNLN